MLAGYFVAWQEEAVRVFCSGSTELEPFLAHVQQRMIRESPGLLPFQLLRGVLWVGLALLGVRTTHFVEILSSMTLFGALSGWALSRRAARTKHRRALNGARGVGA